MPGVSPSTLTGGENGIGTLVGDDILQTGIQCPEEIGRGITVVGVHGFVAFVTAAAGGISRQLPYDPVAAFDEFGSLFIDMGRFLQYLPDFRKGPLGGNGAAVVFQPRFVPFRRDGVETVGVLLGGVMLPQNGVGVGIVLKLRRQAQGSAVRVSGNQGAAGEVDADADDVGGIHTAFRDHGGDGAAQDFQIIGGMLQCPVRLKGNLAGGGIQCFIHDSVGIGEDGGAHLASVGDPYQKGTSRQSAVVDADGVFDIRHGNIL